MTARYGQRDSRGAPPVGWIEWSIPRWIRIGIAIESSV